MNSKNYFVLSPALTGRNPISVTVTSPKPGKFICFLRSTLCSYPPRPFGLLTVRDRPAVGALLAYTSVLNV